MSIPEFIENLGDFRATDREQCGVIIAKNRRAKVIETRNAATDPVMDYAVTMDDFNGVLGLIEGTGYEVVGFFHTHLPEDTDEPSNNDLEGAEIFPDFLNCVYHPASGGTTWYGGKF